MMTKTNKAERCPVCGRKKKPTIKKSTFALRVGTRVGAAALKGRSPQLRDD